MGQASVVTLIAAGAGMLALVLYAVIGRVEIYAHTAVAAGILLATAGAVIALDPLRRD